MKAQRGFALLALLFAGVLGSGAWLAMSGPAQVQLQAERAVMSLARSRRIVEALGAHATLYPDLYGPAGAGPGHLPCPNRDPSPGGRLEAGLLMRAGPNPPCVAYPAPGGAVPLHINVAGLRAGIDPAAVGSPVLGYRVSAAVVNNPLDRPVNARTLPEVLARVQRPDSLPGVPAAHSDAGWRAMALHRGVVEPAVQRRVAAWVIARLQERAAVPACRPGSPCPVLDALGIVGDPAALLEGVPPARHWFVRNGWALDVQLHVAPACLADLSVCVAPIDPQRALRIAWLPSASSETVP